MIGADEVWISHCHFAGGRGGVIFGLRLRRGLRLPRVALSSQAVDSATSGYHIATSQAVVVV